jgi:hypothetical protein
MDGGFYVRPAARPCQETFSFPFLNAARAAVIGIGVNANNNFKKFSYWMQHLINNEKNRQD